MSASSEETPETITLLNKLTQRARRQNKTLNTQTNMLWAKTIEYTTNI